MRVLIVEDDLLVGDAVRLALVAAGLAADLVASAEAARSALQAETFDLMVIDIGLPRENGLRLLAGASQSRQSAARADPDGARRPVRSRHCARSRRG